MKRAAATLLLAATLTGVMPTASKSSGPAEKITSFHSSITVQVDGSMTVKETIAVVAARQKIKRGIYRDFPTRYRDRLGNKVNVGFEVIEVTRGGRKEPYHRKSISHGTRVYIGNKDIYLEPGEYTYTLTYGTTRQLGFFEDYDELYWNVTGNGWDFPIDSVSAEIHLPEGARILNHAAYTGPEGATGKDFSVNRRGDRTIGFSTTRPLRPREGLTIAVSWPKGIVTEPGIEDRARFLLKDNPTTLIALAGLLLVLAYYLVIWLKVGKDLPAGAIVPLFEPPESFSPAAIRYVMRMGYSHRVFAAAIVNMAVKGYLIIEEEKGNFTLRRGMGKASVLSAGEQKMARKLLGSSNNIELQRRNHSRIGGAVKALKESLKSDFEKLHFVKNTHFIGPGAIFSVLTLAAVAFTASNREEVLLLTIWLTGWTLGTFGIVAAVSRSWRRILSAGRSAGGAMTATAVFLTLFALPFVVPQIFVLLMFARKVSPVAAVVMVLIIGTNLLFYQLLKAPTLRGRRVMDQIEGFKRYLEAAEQDRLDRLNPPEKTPQLFERFLPYALALGVENAWAEKFAGVLSGSIGEGGEYRPMWYSGRSLQSFSPGVMAAGLGTTLASAISSSSTAPGSRSGSGGGGGGSSGGGGGGGGGGGW